MSKENNKRGLAINEEQAAEMMPLPPWLQALRDSMKDAIKAEDLTAIMSAQVLKAKNGDMKAAGFVFQQAHQLLRSENQKRVTIIQNNFYGEEEESRPDKPAKSEPGTSSRLGTLARRAAAGLPLSNPNDPPEGAQLRVTSDEEEKELRRRQEQQEE